MLQLEPATTEPEPGAIRLRERTAAFYLPADADLVPALLDDEANGLVRDWGLVFLPDSRVLLFDRHAPVDLADLLDAEPQASPRLELAARARASSPSGWDRSCWICPNRPRMRFTVNSSKGCETTVLEAAPPTTRTSPIPMTPARQPSRKLADEAGDGDPDSAGSGVARGGASPRHPRPSVQGVADTIRGWFSQAGQTYSKLKEKTQWELIDHSALLRKLVREFRDGDASRALRRAVPDHAARRAVQLDSRSGLEQLAADEQRHL